MDDAWLPPNQEPNPPPPPIPPAYAPAPYGYGPYGAPPYAAPPGHLARPPRRPPRTGLVVLLTLGGAAVVVLLVFLASRAATNSVRDAVTNSFPSEFPGYPGDFPTDFPTDFGDGPEVNDPLEPLFLHSPAEFTEDGPPTELDVAQARSLLPGPRGRAATRRDVVDHSLEWTLTGDQGYDASLVIIATSWESRDAAAAFAHAIADDCAAQGYDRKQLGPPTSGLRCRRGGGDSTYYWVTAHGRISAFYALHDPRPTPAKVAALTRFLEIQVAAM